MRLNLSNAFWISKSVRFRLAGVYVIVFGTTLIVFSMLLYRGFIQTHQKEFDAALYNHAIDVAEAVNVDLFGDLSLRTEVLSEGDKWFPFSIGQAFLEIRTLKGEPLGRSQSLGTNELPFNFNDPGIFFRRSVIFENVDLSYLPQLSGDRETSYRMITYVIQRPRSSSLLLQIAVPLTFLEKEKRGLITFFLLSIPGILLIALITGLYLSRRALRPVHQITEIAKEISAQNLAERVPVPVPKDELRDLALTLNGLLDRLQKAFDVQERFIADAAHQLKTPLSIIRGELDVMLSRERKPEEIMEFLRSASQEINQLTHMTEDLLILARVDAGKASLAMSRVRLDEVAVETVAQLEKIASPRGIRIRLNVASTGSEDYETTGDFDLLGCMLHNLLENAIKYSPDNSLIEIQLQNRQDGFLEVQVRDQGIGIDADRMDQIFQRFFRGQQGKSKAHGSGLGLAIARRIAEVHSGSIHAQSAPGKGSVFTAQIKKV